MWVYSWNRSLDNSYITGILEVLYYSLSWHKMVCTVELEWFAPAENMASFKDLFMKVKNKLKKKKNKTKITFLFSFFFSLLIFYDLSKAKEEKWEQTAVTETKPRIAKNY